MPEWAGGLVIFSEGDTIQFARVSVPTAGSRWDEVGDWGGGWCIAGFCNSISDFIFCCHCEMIQFCRFLSEDGRRTGTMGIFACQPCIYVYLFFTIAVAALVARWFCCIFIHFWCACPLSIKSEMRIVRKFVAYAEIFAILHGNQSAAWLTGEMEYFWVIFCSWNSTDLEYVKWKQ